MKILEKKNAFIICSLCLAASVSAYFLLKYNNFSNFTDLAFYGVLFFLVLEFLYLDVYLSKKFGLEAEFGIFFVLGAIVVSGLFFSIFPDMTMESALLTTIKWL